MWIDISIIGTSLILNILGTYFLAKATIKSAADISKMSGTFWDSNPFMGGILKRDNKNAITGVSLLIPGILLQVSFTLIEIFKKG